MKRAMTEAVTGRNPTCGRCQLCKTSKADTKEVVCLWGAGNLTAKILLVGESPGKQDILADAPFQGDTGAILDKYLTRVGLKRENVYVTHSLKCRPPLNQVHKPMELRACEPYLAYEIGLVKPTVIGLMGAVALKQVLGLDGITKFRGKPLWSDKFKCWCVPTWHPSFLIRNSESLEEAEQFRRDLDYIKKISETGSTGQLATSYKYIKTLDQFEAFMVELNASQVASLDTETFGDFLTGKILTVQFATKVGTGSVISFYNTGSEFTEPTEKFWSDEDEKYIWSRLKTFLEDPDKRKIGQNIKYDYQFLKYYGIKTKGIIFDTMLGHYLLDENAKGQHDLGNLALKFTDMGDYSVELCSVLGIEYSKFDQFTMIKIPQETLCRYACKDVDATLRVYCVLQPRVKQLGLLPLLQKIMLPLSVVLADMEMSGVLIDKEYYQKLALKYEEEIKKTEAELYSYPDVKWLERKQGKPVNFNSSDQMRVLFYDVLKLPVYKQTKTKGRKTNAASKPSTDKEVLERLAYEHPLPKLLLRHRKLSKFYSTYVKPMPDLARGDGRLHTSYMQHTTVTGRLASSNPNLQNIPKREPGMAMELRMGIIAPPGFKLIEADLGQIEFRLLANESKDPTMLADLNDVKMDIHRKIASIAFQMTPEQVTLELREKAKTIVYSVIYGKGEENLAKDTGLSVEQVKATFNAIYARYPVMKAWMKTTEKRAETTGEVIGWTGRRRRLASGFRSGVEVLMAEARRQAVNSPIQGGAHDILSVASIKVKSELLKRGLQSRLIMTIHDSLILEVKDEEFDEVIHMVHAKMTERPGPIVVLLTADVSVGQKLGAMEKLPKDYFLNGEAK
jgi:DNA polymerase-1